MVWQLRYRSMEIVINGINSYALGMADGQLYQLSALVTCRCSCYVCILLTTVCNGVFVVVLYGITLTGHHSSQAAAKINSKMPHMLQGCERIARATMQRFGFTIQSPMFVLEAF